MLTLNQHLFNIMTLNQCWFSVDSILYGIISFSIKMSLLFKFSHRMLVKANPMAVGNKFRIICLSKFYYTSWYS